MEEPEPHKLSYEAPHAVEPLGCAGVVVGTVCLALASLHGLVVTETWSRGHPLPGLGAFGLTVLALPFLLVALGLLASSERHAAGRAFLFWSAVALFSLAVVRVMQLLSY